jgi:hypothetical protein
MSCMGPESRYYTDPDGDAGRLRSPQEIKESTTELAGSASEGAPR